MAIHPTALVSKEAEVAQDVSIEAYAIVKGKTSIGSGSRIDAHAIVGNDTGLVKIGKNNHIYSGAVIGGPPQDLKYKGEPTQLEIGDNNMFREFCTVNTGTVGGGGVTRIGSNCMMMAYVHIAHDCHFGDGIVIANTTNFAGHVTVEDHVRIGGVCSFNQFITLGRYAYIAGDSTVNKDILPYSIAQGKYAVVRATNKIGLERAGFSKEEVENINRAIRFVIMGSRTIEEALKEIEEGCKPSDSLQHLVQFIQKSERGVAR
ncbi:MAG: acyl-ACP--UDP-N-acetylglucosamine O-acyltransferase [Bdellovibrionales bacterium]|nr:acyl-ACP--UDP-N-acetylglucosamine O-acyltransferase [Bdellovibrionales bacterium]